MIHVQRRSYGIYPAKRAVAMRKWRSSVYFAFQTNQLLLMGRVYVMKFQDDFTVLLNNEKSN